MYIGFDHKSPITTATKVIESVSMLSGFISTINITSTRSINGIFNSTVMVSNSIISSISNNASSMDTSIMIMSSTTSKTIQNTTIGPLHSTNNVNVTIVAEEPGKSVNKSLIILIFVFGGLLGLSVLMCIVGLVMRSKHKEKNKLKAGKFSSAHFNPLFHR